MKPHGNTKHGSARRGKKTPTYKAWESMIRRCTMPSQDSYPDYGGAGITVCERWASSFENFLADMGEMPADHSLDRFPDQKGNYEPGNCRWATMKAQQRNRRSNRLLTHDGLTMTVVEWQEKTGIPSSAIRARLDLYHWSVEKALTFPSSKGGGASRLGRPSPRKGTKAFG